MKPPRRRATDSADEPRKSRVSRRRRANDSADEPRKSRVSRRRRAIVWMSVVLGALILGVGFLGVWLGPKVLSVKHDLEAALEAFPALKDPKDLASMKASVDVIAAKAEDADITA